MSKKSIVISGISIAVLLLFIGAGTIFVKLHSHTLSFNGPSMEPTIRSGQSVYWQPYPTGKNPTYNDLVIFSKSGLKQYGQQDTLRLVKRVVGLPGDRVEIAAGSLKVFNAGHPDGYNPDTKVKQGSFGDTAVNVTLKSDAYFVLGDNLTNSLDSRFFGPVTLDTIGGRVDLDSGFAKFLNSH